MISLIDTSVLIDHTRGVPDAHRVLLDALDRGVLHSSEIVRAELLVLIRDRGFDAVTPLLDQIVWHPVDRPVAERAGEFGRRCLPAYSGIDAADLVVAATADLLGAELLTRNVKHFPMFEGLAPPY